MPARFNLGPSGLASSYPSSSNTPSSQPNYAAFNSSLASYSQIPALTTYGMASTNPSELSTSLMTNLTPYNSTPIPYTNEPFSSGGYTTGTTNTTTNTNTNNNSGNNNNAMLARNTTPIPVIYANFPSSGPVDRKTSVSPNYHTAVPSWPSAFKDGTESNVQTQNDYSLKGSGMSSVPISQSTSNGDYSQGGNSSSEGLQRWLAVSQQSNPVNSILRLETTRLNSVHHAPKSQLSPYEHIQKITPLANSSLGHYARVEQTWYSRLSSQGRWPGTDKRWYDVLQGMSGDLFNTVSPTCPMSPNGGRTRVSEACRVRMMNTIYPTVTNPYHPQSKPTENEQVRELTLQSFPSCAAFDKALDIYFSSFLREAPFLHMPAFSISTCHPLLLFVMSCIGFGLEKTHDGCHFVQSNFNCIRDRIVAELERKLSSTTQEAMSVFATSFLFLKLAALINDRDHLSPCQLLYISLISLAQMKGMFSEFGKRTNAEMYSGFNTLEEKWIAWGRIESLKRISVSLMRLDSAYGTFLRSAPIIRVANLEVLLPCDDKLFEAPTAQAWYTLLEEESYPIVMPPMTLMNSLDRLVGTTYLDYYSLHAVLNYLQLRSLDAYQKLLDFQATQEADQFVLVPFQYYLTEPSLHTMTLHVVAFVDSYRDLLPRFPSEWQRTNCLVFWHFLCLSLTMNQDLFEIAAGREGLRAASNAIDSIAMWSKTPAARRALVHAGCIYKLLAERTKSEMSSLYAAFATFAAALVMTLYVFANSGLDMEGPVYELTSEVQWQGFGLAGLNESATTINGSDAEAFILHGGPCLFRGQTLRGFAAARYVLDLYADLLKTCGRYNYREMSHILFMMSDLLKSAGES
ncbi:C2H2 type zinc finger domain protein [Taphrina deformans PYCC 5710]|uniref:C2H2 type zinc finger domain protein n=1 Tax=Taphrina deformans (strain PYCC 5710 / ATCC 11124 / CBS 356.35 / IMI 108563 / JCM 9778 / NBRC 8474) TaxID=1097556 RepID=R4X7A5_TAPDE|nr:C2H2 type zinc finger domain protein [Taphrina deformans PYCC 5710]|eukprot:CCG80953.1 C2H2 type zinc finger domain protein [Taphrina deformans PYCC 5710]